MIPHTLVIYHGNCVDGFGAAWCFHDLWRRTDDDPELLEFYPGVYNKPPPDVKGKNVILVDFSYDYDIVKQMLADAQSVTLIDHHESAIRKLLVETEGHLKPELPDSRYRPKEGLEGLRVYCHLDYSGAMLARMYTTPANVPVPKLIEHIQDRDLWRFKLPYTVEINDALFSYPYDFKVWDELMQRDVLDLVCEGVVVSRKSKKDIHELLGVCVREMVIEGYTVPIANVPYMQASAMGHNLAVPPYKFAGSYYDTATERCFSLRSNLKHGGINVAEIAERFGGGGHASAAGFQVPRDHPLARA